MYGKEARQQLFANVFMELIAKSSPDHRVTVVDITNAIGCERKTFYYYFDNIDDLIIWILRSSFRTICEESFSEHTLVKPSLDLYDPYPDWPFYARIKTGNRFLAQNTYFYTVSKHWENHRDYYSSMFKSDGTLYTNLFAYLVNLYVPVFKEDILYMAAGKPIPPDVLNFLAEYHVMGIFGRVQWHFGYTKNEIRQEALAPYWNYAHTCIQRTIDNL